MKIINLDLNIYFDYSHLLLFIFLIILILYLFKKSTNYGVIRNNNELLTLKSLNESFMIFKEIKISNKTLEFVNKFNNYIQKYYKTKAAVGLINLSPKILFELAILFFFYLSFLKSNLEINQFISNFSILALAALRIVSPLSKITSNLTTGFYQLESLKIIYNDLNNSIKLNNLDPKLSDFGVTKIKLENISHSFINQD